MTRRMRWNISEFERLRRKPEIVADIARRAAAIRNACGTGYTTSSVQGSTRARATVAAYTMKARYDNARNNTLLRNLDSGR